jgi:hypothetical protein
MPPSNPDFGQVAKAIGESVFLQEPAPFLWLFFNLGDARGNGQADH